MGSFNKVPQGKDKSPECDRKRKPGLLREASVPRLKAYSFAALQPGKVTFCLPSERWFVRGRESESYREKRVTRPSRRPLAATPAVKDS